MDRIIPEKQAAIVAAVFGLAVGTAFGWSHLEAESKKQQVLDKNNYFELVGICGKTSLYAADDPSYIILQSKQSDHFVFSTAMKKEIYDELNRSNKPVKTVISNSAFKGSMPGFVHIYSTLSFHDGENPLGSMIGPYSLRGVLFCPSLALNEIRETFSLKLEQIEDPKKQRLTPTPLPLPPWWNELHRGVKEV